MNDKNRNCLRRISEQNVSSQSIITVIDRFVQSVNLMEETILIPSKLMDKQVGDSNDSIKVQKIHNKGSRGGGVRDIFTNTDLLNIYNTLTSAKIDLLWGNKKNNEIEASQQQPKVVNGSGGGGGGGSDENNEQQQQQVQPAGATLSESSARNQRPSHARCPSTVSVSSGSSTISDFETEVSSNDNDSGVESEGKKKKNNNCQELEEKFRYHLYELQKSLESMTETANYLSSRYQCEVGSEHC